MEEYEVELRKKYFNMTDAQARRLPGWNTARHRGEDGEYYECLEQRDKTGQVVAFKSAHLLIRRNSFRIVSQ
jgi:hypothetical protein